MKKDNSKVIGLLADILKKELAAVNQYAFHAQLFKQWGFQKLADHEKRESQEEAVHVELLAGRILSLGGVPDYQNIGTLHQGTTPKDALEKDLKLEFDAIGKLAEYIAICEQERDYASRDLFVRILKDEESHIGHIECIFSLIKNIGMENYLSRQV